MTTQNPGSGDFRRDEVIAGEYVLGVLSAEDRRKVEARIVLDRTFAAMVNRWQDNLSSFEDDYAPVAPPPKILAGVERRLFPEPFPDLQKAARGGFWNSLLLWRGLTLAGVLATLSMVALNGGLLATPQPAGRPLVAELAAQAGTTGESSAINLLAQYDQASGTLKVIPVAARQAEEKSLELWLIDGDKPPKALGVLPQTGEGEIVLAPELRNGMTAGTTLAVSIEPRGGSPKGAPTGPVVALGQTRLP